MLVNFNSVSLDQVLALISCLNMLCYVKNQQSYESLDLNSEQHLCRPIPFHIARKMRFSTRDAFYSYLFAKDSANPL